MTQGYVILGVDDTKKSVNIGCAYALGVLLKKADPSREVCVIVDKFTDVPKKYEAALDYIVKLPYGRTDNNHHNMYLDFWQIYHCTPFDETMFIDTYSFAVDNIASLWDISKQNDLIFTTAKDFRGDLLNNDFYLPQQHNDIEKVDAGIIYFTQSDKVHEFFSMVDVVFRNWRYLYQTKISKHTPDDFDFDLMIGMSLTMLGTQAVQFNNYDYTDVTYHPELSNWLDSLNIWVTDDFKVKINNYRQAGIIRYKSPKFLTNEMIRKIDAICNKKITT